GLSAYWQGKCAAVASVHGGIPVKCVMILKRLSALAVPLAFLGCAPKPVPARLLAYPVLVLESYGPAVYPDEAAFCTTTENGQDRYRSMTLMDATGRRYSVAKAMAKSRDKHWIRDLAGNAPVHMDVSLKPEEAMNLAEAKTWISSHIQAKSDYLDLIDGGRAQALADLQADATLDSVFLRFAGPYSVKTVLAKAQKEADERAGVSECGGASAVEHPGRKPSR
ncbi:MAG: hypothetical protein NTY19_08335, partial [Planctomycetota bacterium]|nr:hypothetical protein [Planctomycetota bacterium]